jgi:6-phosphogluconate dehydrogenase
MKKCDIGLVGLAVMGENLALNLESRGLWVAVTNRTPGKVDELAAGRGKGKRMAFCHRLEELVQALRKPRKVMLMVKAGKAVDETIDQLLPLLGRGDIIIDGGNSHYRDTDRRTRRVEEEGLLYIGTGVSGGEEGALKGPSIMPGGSPKAWKAVQPLLTAIAAKAPDGTPCCDWVGAGGAGHFVKMVHNGIEYGDMQMICEAYSLLERVAGLSAKEMHAVFARWNKGVLNSYLIEITAEILARTDPETGRPMVDVILDAAGQKGTGKWTSEAALDLGIPAQTIAEAVFARCLSALKEERVAAARVLPTAGTKFAGDPEHFVRMVQDALYASKICSYAQGFQILRSASAENGWKLDFGRIAQLWRAGCIIRAQFLDRIKAAYDRNPNLPNLMLDPYFKEALGKCQWAWREVVTTAVKTGLPAPAFGSALAYFDGYRAARLPANLLQAQRDYFGAHTYERVDRPRGEFFHTHWTREEDE